VNGSTIPVPLIEGRAELPVGLTIQLKGGDDKLVVENIAIGRSTRDKLIIDGGSGNNVTRLTAVQVTGKVKVRNTQVVEEQGGDSSRVGDKLLGRSREVQDRRDIQDTGKDKIVVVRRKTIRVPISNRIHTAGGVVEQHRSQLGKAARGTSGRRQSRKVIITEALERGTEDLNSLISSIDAALIDFTRLGLDSVL
jgi:hypothetical protein